MKAKSCISIALAFLVNMVCAGEPYNYAELWRSYSEQSKQAYIEGFVDGVSETFFTAAGSWLGYDKLQEPVSEKVKAVRERVFVRYTKEQLPAVITDLYKDPANAYILFKDMLLIARDKIEGKKIDDQINEGRKHAMESHKLSEEQEHKK